MTRKEQQRAVVFNQLHQRRLTIADAARVLALSERQVKRLLAAYRIRGPAALVHGNRPRRPVQREASGRYPAPSVSLFGDSPQTLSCSPP